MSSKADTRHQISTSLLSAVNGEAVTMEQLRRENIELRQENAVLNEVISTVGSTLKLDEVLRHLVDIVVRAMSCHHAFIYMYDKDKERLILTCTSERHQHLVGKITMALGEGIVGWVALHRTPVYLQQDAMEDPRFRYFPELEEEKFQAMMTVPIIARDQHVIGVMMLQAVAPHELTEQHRGFISNMAVLAASAIENAQLYANTQRKLSILTSLSVLSQTISSGLYLDEMLRSMATLTVQILEADLCVIMLMDSVRDADLARHPRRLTVRATSPNLNDRAHFQSIEVDRQALEQLRELNEAVLHSSSASSHYGQAIEMNIYALKHLNPLSDSQYKTLISAPIIAGTEQLGLINCYMSKARRYTPEDQTLLTTIANQAAIAIKNSHLVNQLAQKNLVKGFFDDLMDGNADLEDSLRQRASFLGCDLSRPHAVLMIEIAHLGAPKADMSTPMNNMNGRQQKPPPPESSQLSEDEAYAPGATLQATYKRVRDMVRRRIQDSFPGSLFYEYDNVLTCILSFSKDSGNVRLKTWLYDLARQVQSEYHVSLSIGIGNLCESISDYRRGFAEAREALQMGQNLHRDTGSTETEMKTQSIVTHFNDLGVYRYLYKIAHMDDLRDMYQDQIDRIASYDRRKNTDLLMTLETYLECAGNLTKTSERLYVHRNTLIQRLERIQSLCEVDLQDRANWLTLQIAIKVYKLRIGSL